MSLIYCPEQRDVFDPAFYTAAAAVSVCRTVSKFFKKETTIKWVNDIYSDGKKISGILTEGKIDSFTGKIGAIVVGIGVNVNTPKNGFPEEIKNRAGAILEKEIDFDFRVFVDALAEEVFKVFDLIPDSVNQVMNEYRNKSNLIGKKVAVTPVIESDE